MQRLQAEPIGQGDDDGSQAARRVDNEFGVQSWWTPLTRGQRRQDTGPRVTEDGLKVPDWWTDDESESQQWLSAQGVVMDA